MRNIVFDDSREERISLGLRYTAYPSENLRTGNPQLRLVLALLRSRSKEIEIDAEKISKAFQRLAQVSLSPEAQEARRHPPGCRLRKPLLESNGAIQGTGSGIAVHEIG